MNLTLFILTGMAVTFLATVVATYILRKLALRIGLVDQPDFRKIHKNPIPRIGGLAIFAGFLTGHFFFLIGTDIFPEFSGLIGEKAQHLIIGTIAIALTGLVDDIRGISFRQKMVMQSLAAVYMILAGFRLHLNLDAIPFLAPYADDLTIPLTFIWILGVINAMNLLDGLDGLAGGTAFVSLMAITGCLLLMGKDVSFGITIAMAGAILGFMVFNYNPASIFMGDTGSLFLGFFLASLSLTANQPGDPMLFAFIPILCLGMPVFDTLLAIIRRKLSGKPIFYPDKHHIHHRLCHRFGIPHKYTSMILWGFAAYFGGCALIISTGQLALGVLGVLLAGGFVVAALFKLEYVQIHVIKAHLHQRKLRRNTPRFRTFVNR